MISACSRQRLLTALILFAAPSALFADQAQSVVTASQPVGVYALGLTQAGSYAHPTAF
jgi:hypothetical protein